MDKIRLLKKNAQATADRIMNTLDDKKKVWIRKTPNRDIGAVKKLITAQSGDEKRDGNKKLIISERYRIKENEVTMRAEELPLNRNGNSTFYGLWSKNLLFKITTSTSPGFGWVCVEVGDTIVFDENTIFVVPAKAKEPVSVIYWPK